MRENIRLGIILFIITAVAGIFLGIAYEITKEPIENQVKINSSAVGDLLPGAREVKKLETSVPEGSAIKEVNAVYDGDRLLGHTVRLGIKGFHGPIELVVGITQEGTLGGIKVLSHTETPGLGANIEKDSFRSQFKGKTVGMALEVVKTGAVEDNEIEAISGATISSRGVTSGINEALKYYSEKIGSRGGNS